MKHWPQAFPASLLFSALMNSPTIDCSRTNTPLAARVCRDSVVARLDRRLNELHGDLQPQLTTKAQGELRAQQRAGLSKRDHVCATGAADCLGKVYEERIDQLSALDAESRPSNDKLDSVAPPFTVVGTWSTTAVRDPLAAKPASGADLRDSLARADLPDVENW